MKGGHLQIYTRNALQKYTDELTPASALYLDMGAAVFVVFSLLTPEDLSYSPVRCASSRAALITVRSRVWLNFTKALADNVPCYKCNSSSAMQVETQ